MSSQQRINEAATVAPYLTHMVSHHGQFTLVPPDNAGRVRKPKAKKRPKPERNDEEMRFNTGPPRSLRSQPSSVSRERGRRQARPARPERTREGYHEDIYIPDYPPPSFQEAISTPATTSPAAVPPLSAPTAPHSPPALVVQTAVPSSSHIPEQLSSLIIPPYQPSEPPRSPSEQSSSTMPTSPLSPSSLAPCSPTSDSDSDTGSIEIVERMGPSQIQWEEDRRLGLSMEERVEREKIRRRAAEEALALSEIHAKRNGQRGVLSDSEDDDAATIAPSTRTRRRRMLSPLKALSSRHPLDSLASTSAASSSTYSLPIFRTSPPSRSTTSLVKPLGSGSAPSVKSESVMSRKLFLGIGKDRDGKGKEKEGKGKERERLAIDSEPFDDWEVIESSPSPEPSPPRREGSPTPTPFTAKPSDPDSPTTPTSPTQFTTMRDRKVPPPPSAFLHRQVKRPPPPPPVPGVAFPTLPVASSPSIVPPGSSAPTGSTKKRPPPPPPPPKKTKANPAPPIPPSPIRIIRPPHEIPLPLTPLSTVPPDINVSPPVTPDRSQSPPPTNIGSPLSRPPIVSTPSNATIRVPSSMSRPSASSPPSSPVRSAQHYYGRPLPPAPAGPRPQPHSMPSSPIGSGYGFAYGRMVSASSQQCCPVGDLIDLRDSRDIAADAAGMWSYDATLGHDPFGREDEEQPPPSPAPTVSSDAPSFANSASSLTLSQGSQSTLSRGNQGPSTGGLSEFTDLDVLLSRMEDENHSGADYDTLLLVSEFVGSASPTITVDNNDNHSTSLLGKVELQRRRQTKDGRVKLKLSVLGVAVDKCGICLSQFKADEWARLGATCQHAFHERCLESWLARSRTCPLCRAPVDTPGI